MTYYWFGGTDASYVVSAGVDNAATFQPGTDVKAWASREGMDQLTDLLDEAGQATTVITASDGTNGYPVGGLPRYQATQPTVWLGADGEPRVLAVTTDLPAMIEAVAAVAAGADAAIESHSAAANGHGTGVANLVDVSVPPPEQRNAGDVFGVLAGGTFGLLPPSQAAGAVLLNPVDGGGAYVGNTVPPPDASLGAAGPSWIRMQAPYSADDDLPDMWQYGSTTPGGLWVKTNWGNGNGEGRRAPSTANRIADRVFECAEAAGGPSTGRFVEWSTNPANPALREPLLGGYGTGHPSKPGWVETTRILSALKGVSAGGNHNALSAAVFRGRSASTGAPVAGVWLVGDVVLDADGVLWLCTAAGEPGAWISGGGGAVSGPGAYVDMTPGVSMSLGAKAGASRLERGGDAVRLRGTLTATGTIASGAVLATVDAAHLPQSTVTCIARYTGGGAKLTINTDGTIVYGSGFTAGQSLWLDSITYDREP